MNLTTFVKTFATDEVCRAHMQSVRWPNGPVCPKCGTINDAAHVGGRPGVFRCNACKSQFTVTVGTAMEGTHLPLNIWYLAMYLMMSTAEKPPKPRPVGFSRGGQTTHRRDAYHDSGRDGTQCDGRSTCPRQACGRKR